MEEGVKQAKEGTIKGNPGNKISTTTNKTQGTYEAERQVEGGAVMPDITDKTIPPKLCGYFGKFGHYEAKCHRKKSESALTSR